MKISISLPALGRNALLGVLAATCGLAPQSYADEPDRETAPKVIHPTRFANGVPNGYAAKPGGSGNGIYYNNGLFLQ